nr:helix-turn-helix transcriptional regulator [Pandoraea iniqua]
MDLADRLREVMRERRVKSQMALHRMSGVPQPTINRLLRGYTGSPDSDTISKLAVALSVHAEWLLTGRGDKEVRRAASISRATDGAWPFAFSQARYEALPDEHRGRIESYALATIEMWESSAPKQINGAD